MYVPRVRLVVYVLKSSTYLSKGESRVSTVTPRMGSLFRLIVTRNFSSDCDPGVGYLPFKFEHGTCNSPVNGRLFYSYKRCPKFALGLRALCYKF